MTFLVSIVVVLVASMVTVEATMQPSARDRVGLVAIFAGVAALTAITGRLLPRLTGRLGTLRDAVLVVALAAVGVAAAAVGLSAGLMFLSAHDLRLVLVSLGLGVALAIVLAVRVTAPLARDLRKVGETAHRIGSGDLTARTGIERPDEVGAAAAALDSMAARLSQADAEREQAEATRRAFLAAVSHDLRTPLTALQAALEALQDGVVDDPDRYLRSMHLDLEFLSSLVDDLFLLVRIETGRLAIDPAPVDLAEIADEAVEALTPVARRRGVELRLRTEGGLRVLGGPGELSRVIRNLLDNAIRHAPEATAVDLEVANGSGRVRVRVEDQGPGFPAEFTAEAVRSFTRADPARTRPTGGAGLGLAIASGLVAAHGGTLWIEAGPGGSVGFELPALVA